MCFFFFLLHKQNTEKQQQQQDEHCNKYKNRQNPSSNATATQPHTKPKATSPRHVPIYELLFQNNSRHGSPSPACVSIRVARVNYYFSLLRKASARGVIKKKVVTRPQYSFSNSSPSSKSCAVAGAAEFRRSAGTRAQHQPRFAHTNQLKCKSRLGFAAAAAAATNQIWP